MIGSMAIEPASANMPRLLPRGKRLEAGRAQLNERRVADALDEDFVCRCPAGTRLGWR